MTQKVEIEINSLFGECGDILIGATLCGVVEITDEDGNTKTYPFSFKGKVGTPADKPKWYHLFTKRYGEEKVCYRKLLSVLQGV